MSGTMIALRVAQKELKQLREFRDRIVEQWDVRNKCHQEFGKDVRHLMLVYGFIRFDEETKRYEVIE
jgi:hypothetical protein